MVKTHNCLVKINNGTGSDFTYERDWYDSGRLADEEHWPATIKPTQETNVLNYEPDWSLEGCSGYVTYTMYDTEITIAFSNPSAGRNKLGVGTGGKRVWDDMENHSYEEFTVDIGCNDSWKTTLRFNCKCTGGTTNKCTVNVSVYGTQ